MLADCWGMKYSLALKGRSSLVDVILAMLLIYTRWSVIGKLSFWRNCEGSSRVWYMLIEGIAVFSWYVLWLSFLLLEESKETLWEHPLFSVYRNNENLEMCKLLVDGALSKKVREVETNKSLVYRRVCVGKSWNLRKTRVDGDTIIIFPNSVSWYEATNSRDERCVALISTKY